MTPPAAAPRRAAPPPRLPPALRRELDRRHPGFFSRPIDPAAFCLWSHVGLARNLARRPFPAAASPADHAETLRQLSAVLARHWGPLDVFPPDSPPPSLSRAWFRADRPLDSSHPDARHAVPRRARRPVPGIPARSAAFLDRDALRLSFDAPGERLAALWKQASACDDALSADLPCAFSPDYGYLLSSPSLTGNGLSVRCILHLPATALLGLDEPLSAVLREAGCALVPWLAVSPDPDRAPGALYECARVGAHLLPEDQVVRELRAVVRHVCDRESATLVRLRGHAPALLLDRARRAPAALSSAYRARAAEALDWLSDLRIAALLGLPGLDDPRQFLSAALAAFAPRTPSSPDLPDDLLRPLSLSPFLPPPSHLSHSSHPSHSSHSSHPSHHPHPRPHP